MIRKGFIMYITNREKVIRIDAEAYTAEVSKDRIDLIIAGERVARLSPVSYVCAVDGGETPADAAYMEALSFSASKEENGTVFTWEGKSAVWERVRFILRASESFLDYCVKVCGSGEVDSVMYFKGIYGSEYEFDRGFTPIPTVDGRSQCEFAAQGDHEEFSYLTIPPLFVYVFDICGIKDKLAFALAAERG